MWKIRAIAKVNSQKTASSLSNWSMLQLLKMLHFAAVVWGDSVRKAGGPHHFKGDLFCERMWEWAVTPLTFHQNIYSGSLPILCGGVMFVLYHCQEMQVVVVVVKHLKFTSECFKNFLPAYPVFTPLQNNKDQDRFLASVCFVYTHLKPKEEVCHWGKGASLAVRTRKEGINHTLEATVKSATFWFTIKAGKKWGVVFF